MKRAQRFPLKDGVFGSFRLGFRTIETIRDHGIDRAIDLLDPLSAAGEQLNRRNLLGTDHPPKFDRRMITKRGHTVSPDWSWAMVLFGQSGTS